MAIGMLVRAIALLQASAHAVRFARRSSVRRYAEGDVPHVRRKRYAGRYPRHFEERHKEHSGDAATVAKVLEKGSTPAGTHVPIMVAECLDHLDVGASRVAVDCTLGYGGHTSELIGRLPRGSTLLCFDRDGDELAKTSARLSTLPRFAREGGGGGGGDAVVVRPIHSNYARVADELAARGLAADCLLADLGCSSMQVDDPRRGFTYKRDGPLDMRMDCSDGVATAADFLASADVTRVAEALREASDFGKRDSRELAAAMLRGGPATTTADLASRVRGVRLEDEAGADGDAVVKRAMQALRISVNGEFEALESLLRSLPRALAPGGRAVFLTFHSGEDRRVKKAFKAGLKAGLYSDVARRVVRASPGERRANPRASCCKLRWAVRAAHSPEA